MFTPPITIAVTVQSLSCVWLPSFHKKYSQEIQAFLFAPFYDCGFSVSLSLGFAPAYCAEGPSKHDTVMTSTAVRETCIYKICSFSSPPLTFYVSAWFFSWLKFPRNASESCSTFLRAKEFEGSFVLFNFGSRCILCFCELLCHFMNCSTGIRKYVAFLRQNFNVYLPFSFRLIQRSSSFLSSFLALFLPCLAEQILNMSAEKKFSSSFFNPPGIYLTL